jgi:GGDEF domain-containing protein
VPAECAKPVTPAFLGLVERASIGLAIYPVDGRNAETLVKSADMAISF